jgi:hypothetical protein
MILYIYINHRNFMKIVGKIFIWILIVLFFPMSLIFVAYYRQQKSKKEYYKNNT